MSLLQFTTIPSPFGMLWAARTGKGLSHLLLPRPEGRRAQHPVLTLMSWRDRYAPAHLMTEDPAAFTDLREWLDRYFEGEVMKRRPAVDLRGTPFQTAVWKEIDRIPYGHTITYGEISRRIGRNAGSSRAVGAAVGANPVSIVVPCHRVLGEGERLTGYGGGLGMKEELLRLEGNLLL